MDVGVLAPVFLVFVDSQSMGLHRRRKAINHVSDVSAVRLLELLVIRLGLIRIVLRCVSSAMFAVCFECRILRVSTGATLLTFYTLWPGSLRSVSNINSCCV